MIALGIASASVVVRSQDGTPRPTFRARADIVSVGVSIRDGGRPVTGLKVKDFDVVDNGVRQKVLDVTYEKLPIDVTVVLDVSQSVTGAVLDEMQRAVGQLRGNLTDSDRLKVIAFNAQITRLLDFSDDRAAANTALAEVKASGGTALLDALAVALAAPNDADRRQLIVLFSDGIDTASVTDLPTILNLERHGGSTIACVLPALPDKPVTSGPVTAGRRGAVPVTSPALVARELYTQLSQETGGVIIPLQANESLTPAFSQALGEFRSSYVVHFVPAGVASGGYHTIDVRVGHAGQVRARRGYAWQ
jgi:VWFA-related protein